MEEDKQVIIFGDSAGRLIIGTKVRETDSSIIVEYPHVVDAYAAEGNQQSLRYIPFSYLELFETSSGEWVFPKATHVFNDVKVSEQAEALYKNIVELMEKTRLKMEQTSVVSEGATKVELVD